MTLGMIDYYLNGFPKDSGNLLFARASIADTSLRCKETFSDFTNAFFLKIQEYKEIRQEYEDLNSVLKKKARDGGNTTEQMHYQKSQPVIKRRVQQVTKLSAKAPVLNEKLSEQSTIEAKHHTSKYVEESHEEEDTSEEESLYNEEGNGLLALDQTSNPIVAYKQVGCWWKFRNGQCTNDKCQLKHDISDMINIQDSKFFEALSSPFTELDATVLQKVEGIWKAKAEAKQKSSSGLGQSVRVRQVDLLPRDR